MSEPVGSTRVGAAWLRLREPADAGARSTDLVAEVTPRLRDRSPMVIYDLGSGTGSMGRWLAPRLPGRQHWVLVDRDPDLLAVALADPPRRSVDGAPVTVEGRPVDLASLSPADLAGAALLTASALLDMLTRAEVGRIATAALDVGCPALFTTSVDGRVDLDPPDPLDHALAAAFNQHQRRTVAGRTLLGPDAVSATADAFTQAGATVVVRPGPWRLAPDQVPLQLEWLSGWVGAAVASQPELRPAATDYLSRRTDQATAGGLEITVHHSDLLAHRD